MRKDYLAILIFVKFGFNFNHPKEFIEYICEKTQKMYLVDHLEGKFNHLYDVYGSSAVMFYFFCELDVELREALVDYAINVYAPVGMQCAYEEYAKP